MYTNAIPDEVVALFSEKSLVIPMLDVPEGVRRVCSTFPHLRSLRSPYSGSRIKTGHDYLLILGALEKHCESLSTRATSSWWQTRSSEVSGLSTAKWKTERKRGMLGGRGWQQALLLTKTTNSVRRVCLLPFGELGTFSMWTLILPLHQWQH